MKKNPNLDLPKQYNHQKIESEITQYWKKHKTKEKSLKQDSTKPLFSFLEGPPTANAPPALHHMEARTYKDLRCRYKYMKGFTVLRKGGWDCHGLPVEVQVEKKLGLKTKKDIENYGIKKFIETCKKEVFSQIDEWGEFTDKIAYWIDLEKPYITMEKNYIESVWWSLKELHDRGELYEGHRVSPYCTRCSTTLSNHETSDEYQEITEPSITVKFKLKNSDENLLAWTTTPWTIPSNMGLAINPDITYVTIEHEGEKYIIAKERAQKYFGEKPNILQEQKGKNLIGKTYHPPFNYFEEKLDGKKAWEIIPADYVTTEEGTGIVHQAPAYGEEDHKAVQTHNLEFVNPIDEHGIFTKDIPELEGTHVLKTDKIIIEKLEQNGKLFHKEDNTHSYPFCWRCKTKLIYYATNSWFIRESKHRKQLVENNRKIIWAPPTLKEGRFGNWLENVNDWNLSRNRFWGTPLPIWKCTKKECSKTRAIGGIKELEEQSQQKIQDLHRPYVDEITIKCECKEIMKRVEYVIDCWYDSGSAPFAQFHYPFENKEEFKKHYPYDHVCEGIDQTRGWFHSLHAVNNILLKENSYKTVLSAGHLVDKDGNKMSKSKGNIISTQDVFEQVGTDATRMFFCLSAPETTKRTSIQTIKEQTLQTLITLWNTVNFIQDTESIKKPTNLEETDKIILYKLNKLIKQTEENIENFKYQTLQTLAEFIMEEISRWYIKINKERLIEKNSGAIHTLQQLITVTIKLLAPFAPYITEAIYQKIPNKKEESIHFETWPEYKEEINEELEEKLKLTEIWKSVISTILKERNTTLQRGVRYPIKKIIVSFDKEKLEKEKINYKLLENNEWLLNIAKKETNTKELKIQQTKLKGIQFDYGTLEIDEEITPEMEREGLMREITRRIQQQRKQQGLERNVEIKINISTKNELFKETINEHKKEIQNIVGATEITLTNDTSGEVHKIKGEEITIKFTT